MVHAGRAVGLATCRVTALWASAVETVGGVNGNYSDLQPVVGEPVQQFREGLCLDLSGEVAGGRQHDAGHPLRGHDSVEFGREPLGDIVCGLQCIPLSRRYS